MISTSSSRGHDKLKDSIAKQTLRNKRLAVKKRKDKWTVLDPIATSSLWSMKDCKILSTHYNRR